MGFGYLLIGYLVTFLFSITAQALQLGFLAMMVGCAAMLFGVYKLKQYCSSFRFSAWTLIAILVISVYHMIAEMSDAFLLELPVVAETVRDIVSWVEFFLTMVFHAALLSSVRELAMRLELKNLSDFAIRNMILILMYGILYLVNGLPFGFSETVRGYFVLTITLLQIIWIFANLFLLLSCNKNICAEGQEIPQKKRYRWEFLNKLGDSFEDNFKRASDRTRSEMEEHLKKNRKRKQRKRKNDKNGRW